MTTPSVPPRLPVGQAEASFQGIWRRVVNPDLSATRKVIAVAWPVALTNLLQSLALTVDLAMVGSLGTVALAATGVATQVFFIQMTLAMGLAAGATALVARFIGAGDKDGADRATTATALLALLLSLPLAAAAFFFDEPLLRMMGAGPEVVEQGSLVLRLLAFGLPGNMLVMAASGALQGAGDTRPGLVVGIGVNLVNILLDGLLIFGNLGAPRLGLAGAAIATSVAYTLGGAAFLVLLVSGRRPVRLAKTWGRLGDLTKRLVRVGSPAFLEQLLLTAGFTAYLVLILRLGEDALAAHQIGLRVQSFAFMPGFGFSAAAAALVGQGLGRGDPDEADRNGWTAITMGLLVMVAISAPMLLFARPLAGLFTDAPAALDLGAFWIMTLVFAMPAIALHFSAAGALRGAGDTRWPLGVSFAGLWLVRLPVAYVLAFPFGWGMFGIWAGYVLEYYLRAAVTTWRFAKGRWKTLAV